MENVTAQADEALKQWATLISVNLSDRLRQAEHLEGDEGASDPHFDAILREAVYESLLMCYWLLFGDDTQRLYAAKQTHSWLSRAPQDADPGLPRESARAMAMVQREDLIDLPDGFNERSVRDAARFMHAARFLFFKREDAEAAGQT